MFDFKSFKVKKYNNRCQFDPVVRPEHPLFMRRVTIENLAIFPLLSRQLQLATVQIKSSHNRLYDDDLASRPVRIHPHKFPYHFVDAVETSQADDITVSYAANQTKKYVNGEEAQPNNWGQVSTLRVAILDCIFVAGNCQVKVGWDALW